MRALLPVLDGHGLHAGAGDGVDDVIHGASARKIIYRPGQALQDGADCNGARALLHRLPPHHDILFFNSAELSHILDWSLQ